MSYMEVTGVSKKKKASREYSGSAEGWGPSGLITYKQRNKNNQRSMTSNPGVLQKLRLLRAMGSVQLSPRQYCQSRASMSAVGEMEREEYTTHSKMSHVIAEKGRVQMF